MNPVALDDGLELLFEVLELAKAAAELPWEPDEPLPEDPLPEVPALPAVTSLPTWPEIEATVPEEVA
jgi:hypothetical protein